MTATVAFDFVLQMRCPDRPGIIAATTAAVVRHGGDIRDAASFGDESTGEFFSRIHLRFERPAAEADFRADFGRVADEFDIQWQLHDVSRRPRVLIAVSKFDHCLVDLLHRWKIGALVADIPLVISNHETARNVVEWHGIRYLYLPGVDAASKPAREAELLRQVEQHRIDLVVLARYMQILSSQACQALAGRCINIHHSFLPSFKGAMPYRQAYDRGVKLIGATAHYVTDDLDEGPIIEQEVRRVSHATSPAEMAAIGRETESVVLARAVRWHLEQRILMNGSKTVVFT